MLKGFATKRVPIENFDWIKAIAQARTVCDGDFHGVGVPTSKEYWTEVVLRVRFTCGDDPGEKDHAYQAAMRRMMIGLYGDMIPTVEAVEAAIWAGDKMGACKLLTHLRALMTDPDADGASFPIQSPKPRNFGGDSNGL